MEYLTQLLNYFRLLRKRFWVFRHKGATYLAISVPCIIVGLGLSFWGARLAKDSKDSVLAEFLKALGPVVLAVGAIELVHEVHVGRKTREEIKILMDLALNGVQRVCPKKEVDESGKAALSNTTSLKVLVLGGRWLDGEENQKVLQQLLLSGRPVKVLIPDPMNVDFEKGYKADPAYEPGKLTDLANRVRRWQQMAGSYSTLDLKIYEGYPVAL